MQESAGTAIRICPGRGHDADQLRRAAHLRVQGWLQRPGARLQLGAAHMMGMSKNVDPEHGGCPTSLKRGSLKNAHPYMSKNGHRPFTLREGLARFGLRFWNRFGQAW